MEPCWKPRTKHARRFGMCPQCGIKMFRIGKS